MRRPWRGLLLMFAATTALVAVGVVAVRVAVRIQPLSRANRMTMSSGCHRERPFEVNNPEGFFSAAFRDDPMRKAIAPPDPTRGLICRYFSADSNAETLYRTLPLSAEEATQTAANLDGIRSRPRRPGVFYHCGEPIAGSYTDVLILAYRDRQDVDVLVEIGGCGEISNGHLDLIGPFQDTGSLFTDWDAVAGPLPVPTCGPGMVAHGRPIPCPSGTSPLASLPPLRHVKVPNVVGLSYNAAEKELSSADLRGRPWPSPNSKAPRGQIVGQTPPAGTVVYNGSEVRIYVAGMR
ncbi:MAG: PASTA domain-containing protein [Actinomycetota bacterium]